jgi:hypothetical protein
MTITFKNDNNVIVYALEKVISYAKRTQQIFVAQCVWWLASIIGLEPELIVYIDNRHSRIEVKVTSGKVPEEPKPVPKETVSPQPRDIQEEKRQDRILKECEEFLQHSKKAREYRKDNMIKRNRINPLESTKKSLRIVKKSLQLNRKDQRYIPKANKTERICEGEIQRRRAGGECLRCAWPSDRQRSHRAADCRRPIKLDKGIASFPGTKGFPKEVPGLQQPLLETDSSENTSSSESSDDSL